MPRPLMQLGIVELENLFANAVNDATALRRLAHELAFRQVPRAVALLTRVKNALDALTGEGHQAQLLLRHPEPAVLPAPGLTPPTGPASAASPPLVPPSVDVSLAPAADRTPREKLMPVVSAEQARQVLALPLTATWESVENARRHLVDLAHPARILNLTESERAACVETARLANAAMRFLLQSRFQ